MLDVLIEVTVGGENQYGILIYCLFVAFKGTQEVIEFGISIVSLAVNACGICVGLALDFLYEAVGRGADLAQLFFHRPEDLRTASFSLRAKLRDDAFAL